MTDHTISLLVTLDVAYRTDDAESIINAIKMIKGVLDVRVNILDSCTSMEKFSLRQQLKNEMFRKIHDFFEMENK